MIELSLLAADYQNDDDGDVDPPPIHPGFSRTRNAGPKYHYNVGSNGNVNTNQRLWIELSLFSGDYGNSNYNVGSNGNVNTNYGR